MVKRNLPAKRLVLNNSSKVKEAVKAIDADDMEILPPDPMSVLDCVDVGFDLGTDGGDKPWHRILETDSAYLKDKVRYAKESSQSYALFCMYVMLDPAIRSTVRVRNIANKRITDNRKQYTTIAIRERYDVFSWKDRATAYDDYINALQLEIHKKKIIDMNEFYADISRDLVRAYLIPYQAVMAKMESEGDKFMEDLKGKSSIKLLREMSGLTKSIVELMKMERLSRGVSTENIAAKHEHSGEIGLRARMDSFKDKLHGVEEDLNGRR